MDISLRSLPYVAARRLFLLAPKQLRYGPLYSLYLGMLTRFPNLMQVRPGSQGWAIGRKEGLTSLRRGKIEILLDGEKALLTVGEWPLWERYYLPTDFPLDGKTVLDVGAGAGETAAFYFLHGAQHIICIESNPMTFANLESNIRRNKWNAEAINSRFELRHLLIPHDFMKMDIEGGEALLMHFEGTLKPAVIEAHSEVVAETLKRRFKMETAYQSSTEEDPQISLIRSKARLGSPR